MWKRICLEKEINSDMTTDRLEWKDKKYCANPKIKLDSELADDDVSTFQLLK